jgi:transcriptional regulator with XRE-family HTH domain
MSLENKVEQRIKIIHLRIAEIRREMGLTQEKFAEKIGVPERTLQYWESTKTKNLRKISLNNLIKLGLKLGLEPDVFFKYPKSINSVEDYTSEKNGLRGTPSSDV